MPIESVEPFTFRRCLRLCLPALMLGALVRILFLASAPEAAYDPDGGSYFEPAARYYSTGKWKLGEKRRWIYPVFLAAMPPLPGSTAQTVAVVQHAIGLCGVVGIGWIVGTLVRRRNLWVPVATTLWAVLPHELWYEHAVAAEPLFVFAFIAAAALALPVSALKNRWRLFGMLAAAAAVMALKPHGRGVWAAFVLVALLARWNVLKWGWHNWLVLALGAAIFLNPGNKRQSNWLWLSSTLPLVRTEGEPWPEYRAALKPAIDQVKAEPLQYPWRQSFYKKRLSKTDPSLISPEWAKLAGDKKYAAVAHDLALGAAKEHPLVYLRMIFLKIGMATMSQPAERMIEPAQFWEFQKIWNEDRWADPSRQSEMRLMYGRDHEAYEAMQSERSGRASLIAAPLERSGKWLAWFAPGRDDVTHELYLRVLWFGALVLLGLFWAVLPAEFSSTRALLLPAFLYLLTVYAVGDALARYALPVEWIGIVLAVLGLDRTLQFVLPLFSRTRESAAPAVVGAGAGA